jgi:hypothetical protein
LLPRWAWPSKASSPLCVGAGLVGTRLLLDFAGRIDVVHACVDCGLIRAGARGAQLALALHGTVATWTCCWCRHGLGCSRQYVSLLICEIYIFVIQSPKYINKISILIVSTSSSQLYALSICLRLFCSIQYLITFSCPIFHQAVYVLYILYFDVQFEYILQNKSRALKLMEHVR